MTKPMLLQEANVPMEVLSDKEKLAEFVKINYPFHTYIQEKVNGERAIISVKEGKITAIRNRNDIPTLHLYPELLDIKFPYKEALLDGEIIVSDKNGKSHFYNEKDEKGDYEVYGLQFRNRTIKDKKQMEKCPVSVVIFDILKVDGELMINKPYSERYKRISLIKESEKIKIAKNFNFEELWKKVKEQDLEGVCLKNSNSLYEMDKRSKTQIKIKNYKVTEIKVEKTEQNEKGVKVTGTTPDNLNIECQIPNVDNIEIGSVVKIKYIERVGNKLIQPTKL